VRPVGGERAHAAEVHQDQRAVGAKHHVGRLEVAVQDRRRLPVQVAEDVQEPLCEPACLRGLERSAGDAGGQGLTGDELERQV
jgi:hypothetical protein